MVEQTHWTQRRMAVLALAQATDSLRAQMELVQGRETSSDWAWYKASEI